MDEGSRRERIVELNNRGNAAFGEAEIEDALAAYREAIALLSPGEDAWAPDLYENLGLCWFNLGRLEPAAVAFLRALDGAPGSRPQAARYLPLVLVGLGRLFEARRHLVAFEEALGAHPNLRLEQLDALIANAREQRGRWMVC